MIINVDKFVASLMSHYYDAYNVDKRVCKCWLDDVLEDQGLEYKDGEIVKTQRRIVAEAKEAIFDNEDERIRKWCISHFKECINVIKDNDEYKEYLSNKVIAWLEKHTYTQRDVDDAYLKGVTDTKNELEKQGEQKVSVDDFKAKDWYVSKVDGKIHNIYYSADNIGPRFKVGDWIAWEELNTAKIVNIDGDRYEVEFIDGNKGFPHIDYIDRLFHLWSIQDAKDGDVLVDVYGNIGIFQKKCTFDWTSYCSLGFHGGFQNFKVEHENDKTHPATKEQGDQLEKAMKEAGYEWNADRKELRKLSQSEVTKISDKVRKEIIDYCHERLNTTYGALPNIETIKRWLTWLEKQSEQKSVDINASLINKMVNDYKDTDEYVGGDYKGKPINCMVRAYRQGIKDILSISKENPIKSTWSEEDEKVLSLMQKIVRDSDVSAKKANELSDWLKSLKERLGGK